MRCLSCHYDLRNLSEDRCPECGRAFDPSDSATYTTADADTPPHSEDWRAVLWLGSCFGVISIVLTLWGVAGIGPFEAVCVAILFTLLASPFLVLLQFLLARLWKSL